MICEGKFIGLTRGQRPYVLVDELAARVAVANGGGMK
jgi:hypothetical protein